MHPPIGKLTEHQEMYIKAIHVLGEKNKVARVKDIAEYLGVTKSSVSSALKHLAEKELILYDPYSYATLTHKGKSLAEELVNKYGVLSDFLTDILAVPEDLAEENACRMEHVVDDFVMERLVQFLKFFKSCDVTFSVGKTDGSIGKAAARRTTTKQPAQRKTIAAVHKAS
jgi:DtxR family Mn-dependent transcriptional regulator